MQALILAGGRGTRLRSLIADRPKPMAEVDGRPFLEHQIEFLRRHHVADLVLCVGYLHWHITEFFGSGERWDVTLRYSIEPRPLGTGGALKLAERFVRGPFVALNGDTFLDLDPNELVRYHERAKRRDSRCVGTLAMTTAHDARDYGTIQLAPDGAVMEFREKSDAPAAPTVINAGLYVLEPELLGLIPPMTAVSLERSVFPDVLRRGYRLYGYASGGYFVDIGTAEGYRQFCTYVGNRRPG